MTTDARARLYPEMRYGGFSSRDGTIAFYTRVSALVTPASRVLDYGCGVGAHVGSEDPFTASIQRLRGKVAEVVGVDVDGSARENPNIDRFLPTAGGSIPVASESVDLCVCDWGLEHFDDVPAFLTECHRVIKPGGYLCLRTPNLLHYSSFGAWLLPFRFHHAVRRALGHFHSEADVFPTLYRCNTRSRLERAMRTHGFDACVYTHAGESHTARAGYVFGLLGELVERFSPRSLAHELHAFARRPTADDPAPSLARG